MNWVDLVIIGAVAAVALAGLKSGILLPASGLGGVVLGVILALRYHGELAAALVEHIDGNAVRQIAAFVAIILGTAVATRLLASLVKSLLSMLFLGWLDRLAGALAGAAVALVVLGTSLYLLVGADIEPLREPLGASTLAAQISQISLISSSVPWCSELSHALGGLKPESTEGHRWTG